MMPSKFVVIRCMRILEDNTRDYIEDVFDDEEDAVCPRGYTMVKRSVVSGGDDVE